MKLGLVVIGGLARDPMDGSIPALQWLVERLARRHVVHVFTSFGAARPERYEMFGATIHHAGAWPNRLREIGAIVSEHRRAPFHLLHGFWLVPPGVVAVTAARIIRRPVLVHLGGGELVNMPEIDFGHASYRMGRFWTRLALRGAWRISAASRPMIESVRDKGFLAERVPLGVALDRWPARPPRPRKPGAPLRIVHVGSLNRVKDQGMLMDAASELVKQGVNFVLDLAGPDTLSGAFSERGADLGLGDRVRWHGYLPHPRLRPLVESADLMWLSSRHEAGPLAVLEAAVVGVPTAGTRVGHVAEWAPDAAVAVAVGDAAGLARETETLALDDTRRLGIAAEAQRRAVAQDADWTAARFERMYAEVINGARRSDPGR